MSKIPQGEWTAIAARYQSGESISKIARSYGCTPPAIHYILKRSGQKPVEIFVQSRPVRPTEEAPSRLVRVNPTEPLPAADSLGLKRTNGAAGLTLVQANPPGPAGGSLPDENFTNGPTHPAVIRTNAPTAALRSQLPDGLARDVTSALPAPALSSFRNSAEPPAQRAAMPAPALPGLDNELHLRAEAAIEMFRSSFDAALAEGSPGVRERLRQAATDLMRVAARTTIVLDRLNTIAERPTRAHNYPRSAHAGEDFGKLG